MLQPVKEEKEKQREGTQGTEKLSLNWSGRLWLCHQQTSLPLWVPSSRLSYFFVSLLPNCSALTLLPLLRFPHALPNPPPH